MRSFIVLLSIFISACASQTTKPTLTSNLRIGLVYPQLKNCIEYQYTGITVFQNKAETYDITFDRKTKVEKIFADISSKNGHELVIINDAELLNPLQDFYDINAWSGKTTIKNGKSQQLQESIDKHSVDLLMVLDTFGVSRKENKCKGIYVKANQIQSTAVVLASDAFTTIDASTLKVINTRGHGGGAMGVLEKSRLENTDNFTEKDKKVIVDLASKQIEDNVRMTYKALGIGEHNYKSRQLKWNNYVHYIE